MTYYIKCDSSTADMSARQRPCKAHAHVSPNWSSIGSISHDIVVTVLAKRHGLSRCRAALVVEIVYGGRWKC